MVRTHTLLYEVSTFIYIYIYWFIIFPFLPIISPFLEAFISAKEKPVPSYSVISLLKTFYLKKKKRKKKEKKKMKKKIPIHLYKPLGVDAYKH